MYFFFFTNNIDLVPLTSLLLASGVAPLTKKPEDSGTTSVPPQWNHCDMSHFKQVLTTPENTITYHNALCLSPQFLHGVRQTQTADLQTGR